MTTESDVFYFGCIDRPGHYMHNAHGRSVHEVGDMPWGRYGEDGKLPPQGVPEVQGQALIHHKNGWTALSFWDRSVDTRGKCNSNFFLRGTYDFAEAVALARTAFPRVWARFKFDVVPFKAPPGFKEKAEQILADHKAMEALRAGEVSTLEFQEFVITFGETLAPIQGPHWRATKRLPGASDIQFSSVGESKDPAEAVLRLLAAPDTSENPDAD